MSITSDLTDETRSEALSHSFLYTDASQYTSTSTSPLITSKPSSLTRSHLNTGANQVAVAEKLREQDRRIEELRGENAALYANFAKLEEEMRRLRAQVQVGVNCAVDEGRREGGLGVGFENTLDPVDHTDLEMSQPLDSEEQEVLSMIGALGM